MDQALEAARELLSEVTPLRKDCGKICGAACCSSLEGEETGMLLFPGEEELCRDFPGGALRRTENGEWLLICSGRCERSRRPLACRMFPLLPVLREGKVRVETDLRARAVCPLSRRGKAALDPAFTEAVRKAGEILAGAEEQRAFLETLSREQEDMRKLRASLGV